jgi:hypothetical protein
LPQEIEAFFILPFGSSYKPVFVSEANPAHIFVSDTNIRNMYLWNNNN